MSGPAKKFLIVGVMTLLCTALLLIPNMTAFSMWFDELEVVEHSLAVQMFDLQTWSIHPAHPPLIYLLLRVWMFLAGKTDLVLRALSMFPGMLAAAFVFRIAADLAHTHKTFAGITATLMFAGLSFVRYYVHQTHNYALLLMFCMATLFFFERWWQASPATRRAYAPGAVLSTIALLYTHYYGAYFVAALDIYALIIGLSIYVRGANAQPLTRGAERDKLPRWAALQFIAALAFAVWIPRIFSVGNELLSGSVTGLSEGIPTGKASTLETISATFHVLLGGLEWLFVLLLVIGLAATWWHSRRNPGAWWYAALLSAVLIGSLTIALAINEFYITFLDRRVIYLLPLLAILIACGLALVPKPWLRWSLAAFAVAVILATPRSEKLPGDWGFRDAVNIVAADYAAGDLVILQFQERDTFAGRPMRYYADQLLPGAQVMTLGNLTLSNPDSVSFFVEQVVAPWLATREDFWLIYAQDPVRGDPSTSWIEKLDGRSFYEAERHEIGWIVIARYSAPLATRPNTPPTAEAFAVLPLPVTFGSAVRLDAYGVDRLDVQAGGSIQVWLDWRALELMHADYRVYLHLLSSPDEPPLAQNDSIPEHLGDPLATYYWAASAQVYDARVLSIPGDVLPGTYLLKLGVYDPMTFERLSVTLPDGSITDGVILAQIEVRR